MMAPVIIWQANSNLINLRLQNYLIKFSNIYLQVHLLARLKILKIQSRPCTERTLYSELFEDLCGSRGALLKKKKTDVKTVMSSWGLAVENNVLKRKLLHNLAV